MTDHTDLAQRAFADEQLPDQPRTPAQALRYITRLLALIPPGEGAGYDGKPAGDNIAPLADGTMVSCSRVCYPDGQLYKVMSNAPNGGPQWVDNGLLPADQHYVPFAGAHTAPAPSSPPEPSVDLTTVNARLARLEQALALMATSERVEAINDRLEAVDNASLKTITWPDYAGRNWAGLVISKPR